MLVVNQTAKPNKVKIDTSETVIAVNMVPIALQYADAVEHEQPLYGGFLNPQIDNAMVGVSEWHHIKCILHSAAR